ncbi:hypothetical protein JKP88DRAFT_264830 [Tribonema minus]|uniref:CHRD domain-containing protein n=1 Tax=Tribonema minus TaxID=303371 RepID=A0A836C9W3_9STRA|nr:hypothetical protein JKP88DRAFT_264830 [Tribonema minus]
MKTNLKGIVAGHIHKGAAGVDGDVYVDLFGGIADLTANPLQACIALTFAQAQALVATPAHYYVNVHTDQFPGGAIRSQLSGTAQPPPPGPGVLQEDLALTGAQVTDGPGDPAGQGTAKFAIAGRTLCFTMKTNLQGIVAEHIHEGAAGVDGDVYVDLFGGIADLTANPLQACITLTHAQAKALVKTPTDYYVNVHTIMRVTVPAVDNQATELYNIGAPAMQCQFIKRDHRETARDTCLPSLVINQTQQHAQLSHCHPVVHSLCPANSDPEGQGTAKFAIAGRTLCFTMKTNLKGIVAGHIHQGAAGVDGDVYVDLFGGIADLTANPLQACITLTYAQAKALVKTPTDYYVNVHTDQFPDGAIRSQLAPGGAPKPPVVPKPEPKALNQKAGLNGTGTMLSDIVGKNLVARASKHLYGRAKTHFSTLVPNCGPENVEIGMKEKARIKALAVPSRPVGETFDFEESTIESEVSWVRTTKFSSKLILTNVVDPATGKNKALYCTPRPTPSSQQEIIFNYTRWADITSYGLVPGKTDLNDGGVLADTNGQHFVVRYGDGARRTLSARAAVPPPLPPPLAPAPAPLPPPPPAPSAPRYNLVTQMPDPTDFTNHFSGLSVIQYEADSLNHYDGFAGGARNVQLQSPAQPVPRQRRAQTPRQRQLVLEGAVPSGMEEYGLSHILSEARPGQGVTSLEDAWRTFLLQRAVIMFNGVLIFHDYTTDPSRVKKTGKCIDTINYKKKGIMKLRRYNSGGQNGEEVQEESVGDEEGGADEEDVEDEGDSEDSDDSDGEDEGDEESGDGAESGGEEDWAEAGRGDIGGGYVSIAPGARTGGIMQAIVDSVTARQLLPPSGLCLYSNAVLDTEYGQLAWPSLSWDVVNSCRLMRSPELTIGNASDIPVNTCIKILSLAAVIGRAPTLDAAISNYNQWVRAENTSLLRPSKCQRVNNGGRYGGGGSGSPMAGDDIADAGSDRDSVRQGGGGYGGGGDARSVAQVAAEAIQNMQRMHAVSIQQMNATHAISLQHLQTLQNESAQQARQAHQAWLAQQQAQQVMYFHMMQNFSRSGFSQLQPPARALSRNMLPTTSVQNAPCFYFTWPGYGFNPPKP